jgi:predicted nucleic acid-binding Zn ribbon protein
MISETKNVDHWSAILKLKTQELKACQNEKSLQSCMDCSKILECQTRDEFVKAVYESMNKGQEGDFEF